MASSTAEPTARAQGFHDRPSMVSVGTIVWLASELMFFAALFAAYFTIRSHAPELWLQQTAHLKVPYALGNTLILVASSIACQMGVFAAERGEVRRSASIFDFRKWGLREWFILTFIMGAVFVSGQAYEYTEMISEGITMSSSGYGSMFFLTTGFHALHVSGGLIAFLLVLGRTYVSRRFTHEQAVSAIVVSYYWHFVDVVWIGLFATIYLLQ